MERNMSTFMEEFKQKYDQLSVGIDSEVDGWFLMETPGPVLTILGIYLLFVLTIGPSMMANRKPYNIQRLLVLYNVYQVIFSTWMCSKTFSAVKSTSMIFDNTCNNRSHVDRQLSLKVWTCAWWLFFSKIIDLLDTVFFVVRKKQNQITFLHVYHHTITALFSWGYLKYLPGEQGIVLALMNSIVHIVMYFYYMLAAMGPKYKKYLWWKRYMTLLQLIQFGLMLFYLVSIIVMDCKLSKSPTYFFIVNVIVFMYLFGNFYRKVYNKKSEKVSNDLVLEDECMKKRMEGKYDSHNSSSTDKPIKLD